MDAATAIAAVIALVGGSLLGVVLNDAVDAVLAIFWPPVVGVEEKELLLARQGPANGHHMRTRLRAALEEQAEEDMAEPAFRLTDLPFALVGGLFQAVGRVLKELVDGLTRVLGLVLVVFASAGSFLRAFGATLVALVVRPFSRLLIGREAPRAAQVQVVQVPRIAVNPPQLFGQGFLATRNGKMHQLADSEEFFRAVAEHLQVPACADLALDMYAVALGLNAEWRGLTAGTVKVYVLCEAVRQLTQDVPLEQVVDAAVMIAPATGPAVADALLQQVHWVLFSHRPFDDTGHTIPEDVRIIGRRVGWLPERMVRVAHASRIATALGVAGRQREIVAAACAIVGDIPVEEIVDRHRYNRRAVENAVTQMTELGVVGLLGPEAS